MYEAQLRVGRQFLAAHVLVKAASSVEQNIMLFVEMSSTPALIFIFYRHNPWISSFPVVTDSGKNRVEIVSQGISIVVLLQFSLRSCDKGIDHDQLPVNRGNTANLS